MRPALERLMPARVAQALRSRTQPGQVWLVGGAVRDALLGRETQDLDFAVRRAARSLAREVADALQGAYYSLDDVRDVGRVLWRQQHGQRWMLDFSALRGRAIEEDLQDRDFTVNAMAVDLHAPQQLIDPLGGRQDLRRKVLRACQEGAFERDPLRTLRAVRFALALELRLDPGTLRPLRLAVPLIKGVSAERRRDELFRILSLPRPASALRLMDRLGLLAILFPELEPLRGLEQPPPHSYDAFHHTLAVVDRLTDLLGVLAAQYDEESVADLTLAEVSLRLGRFRDAIIRELGRCLADERSLRQLLTLAAIYHDVGKAETWKRENGRIRFIGHERVGASAMRKRAGALALSRAEIRWLSLVVEHHMRPAHLSHVERISRRAAYRFFRDAGEGALGAILLSLADILGKSDPPVQQDMWRKRVEAARQLLLAGLEGALGPLNPRPLLRGDELARELGVEPGPQIGVLLEQLVEAQAAGEVKTRQEALQYLRDLLLSGRDGAE